ncbi:Os02g0811101 [Oryza sativa Japonica Group]|jgi:hypothetical protein|uniref:Os02g0811101 protein n=1 Tax=Oryza sativa subsp. japonica TaxID=39947 RepID=C7IZ62_ORYSJ|nr:Os02g0811101 [Oryza sativa Japonica Group]|eukprot:NP_001173200.1 Os02g0811101 [Oryza sativa Japonica Group]
MLGSMNASLVCCANPSNNRPRNSDISRQQKDGLLFGKKKALPRNIYDCENIYDFDCYIVFSKGGPAISVLWGKQFTPAGNINSRDKVEDCRAI